jgi:hypothetical protein
MLIKSLHRLFILPSETFAMGFCLYVYKNANEKRCLNFLTLIFGLY